MLIAAAVQTRQQLDYWSDSTQLFRHDLDVTGPSPTALGNLGIALDAKGKYDDAIGCFSAAMKLHPDDALACEWLALSLMHVGRLDEGIKYFHQEIHLRPKAGMPHCHLGVALEVQGKIDEAVREFHEAIRLSPSFPTLYNDLAWLRATNP